MTNLREHSKIACQDNKSFLVGRRNEMQRLIDSLASVLQRKGCLITINGEAGIGKTALIEEFCRYAISSNCDILKGGCLETFPSPFLVLNQIMPGDIFGHPDERQALNKESIKLGILSHIEKICEKKAAIICIEDIQWIDGASLDVIQFLTKHLWHLRLMILLTYRPEEYQILPDGTVDSIPRFLSTIKGKSFHHELSLIRLNDEEILEICKKTNPRISDHLRLNAVVEMAAGNPLYAVEIVRMIEIERSPLDQIRIPDNIRDIILGRFSQLNGYEQQILEAASAIGFEFNGNILSKVLDEDQNIVQSIIDGPCIIDNFVKRVGDSIYFSHHLVQNIIHQTLPPEKTKILHGLIGAEIEKNGIDSNYTDNLLSYHYHLAGNPEKSFHYSLKCGNAANRYYDSSSALIFFNRAIETIDSIDVSSEMRLDAIEGRADAFFELGNIEEAFKIYSEMKNLSGFESREARIYRKCGACYSWSRLGKGNAKSMEKFLRIAFSSRSVDNIDRAEILHEMAVLAEWNSDFVEAEKKMLESIELFREYGTTDRLAFELSEYGYLLITQGRFNDSIAILFEAHKLFQSYHWPIGEIVNNIYLSIAHIGIGSLDNAWEALCRADVLARGLMDYYFLSYLFFYKALALDLKDDLYNGYIESGKAVEYATDYDYPDLALLTNIILIHMSNRTDRLGLSETLIASINELNNPILSTNPLLNGLFFAVKEEYDLKKRNSNQFQLDQILCKLSGAELKSFYEVIITKWFNNFNKY